MRIAAVAAVFLSAAGIGAACAAPQFSADAVETEPGRDMKYVRIFMGDNASRFEYQVSGKPVIQIVRPAEGKLLTVFPLTRNYTEQQIPPGAAMSGMRASAPCEPSPDIECRKEADSGTAGDSGPSKIERWTVIYKGQPGESHIWWDSQRKIVVRQEFPDGREMQATMRGTMSFENRPVENWEFLYMSPNGTYRRGLALFAQDLGFAVAEQQPGGGTRELLNIEPGGQDAKLFELPADYKKLDAFPPAQPISSAPAQSAAGQPAAAPAPFAQPAMTAPQPQPLQYANPPAAAPGGQPQSGPIMPSTAMPQSGPMTPSTGMPQFGPMAPSTATPQYGPMAPSAMMPPAAMGPAAQAAAQPAQQPPAAGAQPQPMQPQPMQPQPMMPPAPHMMPPAFSGTPYGAPWTGQGEAPKGGVGFPNQAPTAFPFPANPGSPYAIPGNGQPPVASPGTQTSASPTPGNAPAMAPYGWPFGPFPQLQAAEKQVPGNEASKKP